MKFLQTIRDSDVGREEVSSPKYNDRKAARGVVFDTEGNIALFHSTKKHYHKLPGGGVEEGEDLEAALRRELLEEIGCAVKNIQEVGVIEEYRSHFQFHQFSYCYIAEVAGDKGRPHLEEGEIAEGFVTVWLSLDTAIETVEKELDCEDYRGRFLQLRDLIFLKEAQNLLMLK